MGIQLDRLLFDPALTDNNPIVASYHYGAGGDLITSTLVSGKEGLDVNVINASIPVTQSGTWAVQVTDGTDTLAIDASGFVTANINGTVTVQATNLDTRNLTHVSDSVKIGDGTDFLAIETDGSVNVNANLSSPNGASLSGAVSVTTTATALPGTPLANRRKMFVQNTSNQTVYLGHSGVTTSNGILLAKGANTEIEVGPTQLVYGIVAAGTADVRLWERAK